MSLLPSDQDPLGQALFNYWETGKSWNVIVRSGIIANETLPPRYFFREWDEMPEIEQIALKNCNGRILDIGAGAGCHTLHLQEKGLEVTALEVSELSCQVMADRGIRKIVNKSIEEFTAQTFDTILLLMNGIGLAGTLENLPNLMLHLKSLLNPGGQILFDSSDIKYLFEDDDGSLLVNLNQGYYGEIDYQLQYKKCIGKRFIWLFVDLTTAQTEAMALGFKTEILAQGEQGAYLMRLTL